jgi:putative two-component system response regulator
MSKELTPSMAPKLAECSVFVGASGASAAAERWDGTGYPEGRRGTNIPLSARLMAVADTYDAIRSDRVYRAALSHEYAVHVIESQRGTHFEPAIVDAFHRVADIFDAIARSLPDA